MHSMQQLSELENKHDDQKVRFNKLTGKLVMVGPDLRFRLVTWVRNLYTTNSAEHIRKFLLKGVAQEHGANGREALLGKIDSDRIGLNIRTVKEVKKLYESYNTFVENPGETNFENMSSGVEHLLSMFKDDTAQFKGDIASKNYQGLYSVKPKEFDAYYLAGLESIGKGLEDAPGLEDNLYDDLKNHI